MTKGLPSFIKIAKYLLPILSLHAQIILALKQPFFYGIRNAYWKEGLVAPKENQEEVISKLIQGCIKEDRNSQKELYRHYYAYSMGICQRYASNKIDAASIMNDGFFKVFKHIKKYDHTKPFTAWIGRIMANAAIDYYRANLKFAGNENIMDYDQAGSDEAIYEKLNYQDLLFMVQSLSPSYRTVFNLYAIEGYSHEEIAGMLHISVGTSKSNLFKARAKLMEMLKAMDLSVGRNEADKNLSE